ncbi:MAG: hypothetical protein ACRD21_10115 [Vicinamibacteria bacterium]
MPEVQVRDSRRDRKIDDRPIEDGSEDPSTRNQGPRIRCPKCGWEPRRDSLWSCSCFHAWNTFDTRGLCPECGRKWVETQCPRCHEWSRHEEWYEEDE